MTRITAAVCTEFGQPLQLEELDLRAPGAGEIEVTLEAVAICHSDIHFAEGAWGGDLPAVYGHEAAGRVSAVGPGVSGLAEGQRVVVTLIKSCGSCPNCASGKPTICETPGSDASTITRLDGTPVVQAMNCGAFAERVVVDQSQVVPLPDDMPPEAVALMACGVITGVGKCRAPAGRRGRCRDRCGWCWPQCHPGCAHSRRSADRGRRHDRRQAGDGQDIRCH